MDTTVNKPPDKEEISRRRVPCLATYLQPFRLVDATSLEPWNASIEQINNRTWDYSALHEIAGGIDVGLDAPYHLVVARDGAIALPPIPELCSDQAIVEFFNHTLSALLLGGLYCEAISVDGLDMGSILDWKYVRSHRYGKAASNRFHEQIRYGKASPLEAIQLYQPRTVKLELLQEAMRLGLGVLKRIDELKGEYLLRGVTGIARRDWGSALANLWIVVEQLTSHLWKREIVRPTIAQDKTASRRAQLSDTRTWTASARLEMLFQKEALNLPTFRFLSDARKARNDLSHEGKLPSEYSAMNAYSGVCGLLLVVLNEERPALLDLNLADHALSDPFAPRGPIEGEPQFWMAIPKLPGEQELELAEAALRNQK
ncbi:hypothetical protein [Parasphingorhabdus sp.]|uniref:hypothetical protein n=1 Tax=Parasphingorhabdus sp. TaxID=2709688 RepID=UPI003BAF2C2D